MTTPPASDATPMTDAPVPRVAFDVVRLGYACGAGFSSAAITLLLVLITGGNVAGDSIVLCLFAFSAGWSIAYLVHTLVFFTKLDAPRLKQVLLGSQPKSRAGQFGAIISGTGPTIGVQWSIIAIAAVLVFTVWPGLTREIVTVVFSCIVVAASWAVTIVAYALHYARADAPTGDFQFPDNDRGRIFADYIYLAVQVQTTFSTSDVSLMSPLARRIVTGHTLVSFAFATVIIAMLITVIFLGGSS
ncbi:MAG: DUF1345 domain-containing protein [Microbacterium sp.]